MAMDALSRCRACDAVPDVVMRNSTSGGTYYRTVHSCDTPLCETEEAARAEWNAANAAPDPALLALATFGAMVVGWKFIDGMGFDSMQGGDLDDEGKRSGVLDGDFCVVLAPGIAEAIAALLAPDAGEVGNA